MEAMNDASSCADMEKLSEQHWEKEGNVKGEDKATTTPLSNEEVPGLILTGDDSDSESDSSSSSSSLRQLRNEPSGAAAPNGTRTKKRVQFKGVELRIYSITIGDHPLASMYPVSLDWSYNTREKMMSMEEYEREKAEKTRNESAIPPSRGIKAPRLSVTERMARLVDITGKTSRELYRCEQKRQLLLQEQRAAQRRFV